MTNAFNLSQLANNTNSSGQISLTTGVTGTISSSNISPVTGTGDVVLSISPTLVTPLLGTPTSGNLANCTGIPAPAALSTASGSAPSYSARAWVNFNGTGTVAIRASGNVSSITDNAVGNYTVNFTTAMVDANYASTVTSNNVSASDSRAQNVFYQAAASLVVYIRNSVGAGIDVTLISVTVTR